MGNSRVTALWHNSDIDAASTPEDVWEWWGIFTWLTSASILEVLSSDINDTSSGTWARRVSITGVNYKYRVISETVILNGTSPVQTVNSYLRINNFMISATWSNKTNAGIITLRVTWGGTTQSVIATWIGFANSSMYTVPTWFTLSINSIVYSINRSWWATQVATVGLVFQSPPSINSPNWFYRIPLQLSVTNVTPYLHFGNPWIQVPERTDVFLRCVSTSTNDIDLTAGFLWVLKSNNF